MATIINGDGIVTAEGTSTTQGRLRLGEDTDNGTNYVELQAPASVASNVTFTLPSADGTNGQVLQTNGSGALSFATPATGAMTLLSTATASASSSIDFTGLSSTYRTYIVYISNCVPTVADDFAMRTSTNNGSSFDSSASNYVTQMNSILSGSQNIQFYSGANGDRILLMPPNNISSTANLGGYSGAITILNPSNASNTAITAASSFTNTSGTHSYTSCGGARLNSSGAVNAIRFFMYNGNTIASGIFKLYGIS